MSHECGYYDGSMVSPCQNRIASAAQRRCHLHQVGVSGQAMAPSASTACQMRRSGSDWRCLVHSGEAWLIAGSLGASPPCQIPLDVSDKATLAADGDCSVDTLTLLARDGSATVRYAAASNPRLPVDLLRQLATDEDTTVAWVAVETLGHRWAR